MGEQKIAVTTWGGRISPVLDVARRAVLLTVRGGVVVGRREVALPATPGEAKLIALSALGAEVLLCGAVSRRVAERAAGLGVRVIAFLAGDAEAVIAAHLDGRLPDAAFAMPGCRARRRRRGVGVVATESVTPSEVERSVAMRDGDGTGPRGQGHGTCRGLGPCGESGDATAGLGLRGPRRGRSGGGRLQGKGPRGGRRGGAPAGGGQGT
jgi:hypothetical protein